MAEVQKQGKPTDRKDDEFERDLHPFAEANRLENHHPERTELPTAYDIKDLHRYLSNFNDADLKQIVVLPKGTRLEQGSTYVDLLDPDRRVFKAMGHQEADDTHYYAPKAEIPYPLWNRLIGVDNPDRLDEE